MSHTGRATARQGWCRWFQELCWDPPIILDVVLLGVALLATAGLMRVIPWALYEWSLHKLVTLPDPGDTPAQQALAVPSGEGQALQQAADEGKTSRLALRVMYHVWLAKEHPGDNDSSGRRSEFLQQLTPEQVSEFLELLFDREESWLQLQPNVEKFIANLQASQKLPLERLNALRPTLRSFYSSFRQEESVQMMRRVSGWIQWFTFFAAVTAFLFLGTRFLALRPERAALKASVLPLRASFEPTRYAINSELPRWTGVGGVYSSKDGKAGATPIDPDARVNGLVRSTLRWLSDGHPPHAVAALIRTQIDVLRDTLDRAYVGVAYALWCIPILGFLGTAIGIANAMMGSDRLMEGGKEAQTTAIQDVTLKLAYKFDTTFVALILSILVALGIRLVRRYEDKTLAQAEEVCHLLTEGSCVRGNPQEWPRLIGQGR
jgi:hypothetical protein